MDTIYNEIKFRTEGDPTKWESTCLPIGNGYMGATFFGGIEREIVVLNEKTLKLQRDIEEIKEQASQTYTPEGHKMLMSKLKSEHKEVLQGYRYQYYRAQTLLQYRSMMHLLSSP